MIIVYVFPDSPGGESRVEAPGPHNGSQWRATDRPDAGSSKIRGPAGTNVTITVRSPGQSPRDVTIQRQGIRGKIEPYGKRLETAPGVGYLVVPDLLVEDTSQQVESELRGLLQSDPLDGLVIDLRGNGGGLRSVLEGILAQFVTGRVGQFYTQKETYPLSIGIGRLYNQLNDVPLALLVDKGTVSNAEILAAALQARGRAKVVGATTAGNTETIFAYDLDDRSRLWVARQGFKLPDGTSLEGRGVIPDVVIDIDWTNYTERDDPHILKAVEVLHETGKK
jgi:C-terminal peptidase prc